MRKIKIGKKTTQVEVCEIYSFGCLLCLVDLPSDRIKQILERDNPDEWSSEYFELYDKLRKLRGYSGIPNRSKSDILARFGIIKQ